MVGIRESALGAREKRGGREVFSLLALNGRFFSVDRRGREGGRESKVCGLDEEITSEGGGNKNHCVCPCELGGSLPAPSHIFEAP